VNRKAKRYGANSPFLKKEKKKNEKIKIPEIKSVCCDAELSKTLFSSSLAASNSF
jgi:hypothetical protein